MKTRMTQISIYVPWPSGHDVDEMPAQTKDEARSVVDQFRRFRVVREYDRERGLWLVEGPDEIYNPEETDDIYFECAAGEMIMETREYE